MPAIKNLLFAVFKSANPASINSKAVLRLCTYTWLNNSKKEKQFGKNSELPSLKR